MNKMYLNWERLRLFYIVASHGSLTKAAAALGKSPSTLSTLIRTFEQELGLKVFNRQDGILRLNKEGERLYALSQKMYSLSKAEEEYLSKKTKDQGGHVKVIAPEGLLSKYVSSFIDKLMTKYPDIRLEFTPASHLSYIEKFNTDILIHPKIPHLKNYIQEHLVKLDLRLYASKEYLREFGTPKTVQDLDQHKLIGFPQQKDLPIDGNWHLTIGRPVNKPRPLSLEINETFGRCHLCAKGMGIVTVPKQHPELRIYDLVEVLPEVAGPSIEYYMIIEEFLYKYNKIQNVKSFLKEQFTALSATVTA